MLPKAADDELGVHQLKECFKSTTRALPTVGARLLTLLTSDLVSA